MSCPSCSRHLLRALIETTTGIPLRPLSAHRNLFHSRLRRDAARQFSSISPRRIQLEIPRDAQEHDERDDSIDAIAKLAARAVPAQRDDPAVGTEEWRARRFPYSSLLTDETPENIKELMKMEYPLLGKHARKRLRRWAEERKTGKAATAEFPSDTTDASPAEQSFSVEEDDEDPLLRVSLERAGRSQKKEDAEKRPLNKGKRERKMKSLSEAESSLKEAEEIIDSLEVTPSKDEGGWDSFPMDTWSARPNTSKENDATKASSPKKTEKTDGAKPSPSEKEHASRSISLKSTVSNLEKAEEASKSHEDKEPWQIQKAALKAKFGDQGWSPKRRLSPDALEGIRTLHKSNPEVYTTPALAQEFKVSPEAIRRILRSKWRPTEEEDEDRARRWQKRGEQIWNNMAQMGVRPPKKWRDMGAGRVEGGRSVVAPYKKGGQRLGKDDLRWGPGGFREDMVFKPKAPREEGEEEYGDRIL